MGITASLCFVWLCLASWLLQTISSVWLIPCSHPFPLKQLYSCLPFSSFSWKYLGQQRHCVADRPPFSTEHLSALIYQVCICFFFISFHLPFVFFISAPENSCFLQFILFVTLLLPLMHPMQHSGLLLLDEHHQHCSSVRCRLVVSDWRNWAPFTVTAVGRTSVLKAPDQSLGDVK